MSMDRVPVGALYIDLKDESLGLLGCWILIKMVILYLEFLGHFHLEKLEG